MPLPEAMAQANRLVFNPVYRLFSWAVPPFAIMVNRGRRTGNVHATPVHAYRHETNGYIVALSYGRHRDWVANVLAAGACDMWRLGQRHHLHNPRIIGPEGYESLPGASAMMYRLYGTTEFLVLDARAGTQ